MLTKNVNISLAILLFIVILKNKLFLGYLSVIFRFKIFAMARTFDYVTIFFSLFAEYNYSDKYEQCDISHIYLNNYIQQIEKKIY